MQLGLVAQYLLNFRHQSAEQSNLKQAASVVSGLSLLNQHQVCACAARVCCSGVLLA